LALAGAFFLVIALFFSLNLGGRTARQQSQIIDITISTAEQGGLLIRQPTRRPAPTAGA
jgi:hypothetical protein